MLNGVQVPCFCHAERSEASTHWIPRCARDDIREMLGIAQKMLGTREYVQNTSVLRYMTYPKTAQSDWHLKTIRIDEILLDARQQVQQANPDYKIDVHFENDFENDNQISVNGNEYLLKVAFANLFENGCKFSKDKQSIVSISFERDKIKLLFSDNGIGISENDLKHIFTPFYRGENKIYAEGNGIGLSLTQKIILLHKGTISVSSKQNEGTTFYVELLHI